MSKANVLFNDNERVKFGKVNEPIELPNLLSIQKESYKKFLEKGVSDVFKEFSPLEAEQGTGANKKTRILLTFDKISIEDPSYSINECKRRGITYAADVYAQVTLTEEAIEGKAPEPKRQTIKMCELPIMSDQGTFFVNGTERVVVSQLVPSPGVYFENEDKKGTAATIYFANIRANRGLGLWFEYDDDRQTFYMKPNKKGKKTNLLEFLFMLGYETPNQIQKEFKDYKIITDLLAATDVSHFLDPKLSAKIFTGFHKRTSQITQTDPKTAKSYFDNLYFNSQEYDLGEVGRYKLDKRLGLNAKSQPIEKRKRTLEKSDIVWTIKYLCSLIEKQTNPEVSFDGPSGNIDLRFDDINFIGNRRVRPAGELVQNVLRTGLISLKQIIGNKNDWGKTEIVEKKEKTSKTQDTINDMFGTTKAAQKTIRRTGDFTPRDILNNSHILQSQIKAFFGTSQLSQFMDQNNPLAALAHRRRISVHGPSGTRVTARPSGAKKHYDEHIRDVQTDQYGRICPIESPEGQNIGIVYALAAFARVNDYGFIETPYRKVQNGVVTDDVIYLAEDEEREHIIAQASEPFDSKTKKFINTTVLARLNDGEVDDVSPEKITLMDISTRQMVSISTSLIPFLEHDDANRALMGANMQRQAVPLVRSEAPLVGTGSEVRAAIDSGDVLLADADGVVTEVHSDICKVMGDDGKTRTYAARKFERANQTTCTNHTWIVNEGDKIKSGQPIADGPCTKNGELAIGKNLLVAFMNFDGYNYEDAIIISSRIVQEDVLTSIHIEEYEISASKTRIGDEEITRDIPDVSERYLKNLDEEGIVHIGAEVKSGDILVGKVTPKGEKNYDDDSERWIKDILETGSGVEVRNASLVVPNGVSGTVIGVEKLTRENNEIHAKDVNVVVKVYIASKRKIGPGDKLSGRHGNKGVISTVMPIEDMPFLEDGTPVDIILNPLGVPGRMNIGQILEVHLGWIAKNGWDLSNDKSKDKSWQEGIPVKTSANTRVSTPVFDGPSHEVIEGLLRNVNPDERSKDRGGRLLIKDTGKATLIDGRTGEPFTEDIAVGYMYILKLHHLVDDKVHARSRGRRSLITKQPLGGKAKFGGQRIGEMEVWALEAYGAANLLHEMLTIKSDDVRGSDNAYKAIVEGKNIPKASVPETLKVLVREIESLGLRVSMNDSESEQNISAKPINPLMAAIEISKPDDLTTDDNSENKDALAI